MSDRNPYVEYRSASVAEVKFADRIVTVLAVPYEQETSLVVYKGRQYVESFARGAFNGIEKRSRPVIANREHVKGRVVLSMESTANRMHRLGRSVLTGVPLLTPDEMIQRLDAVDRDQIQALAHEFYVSGSLSAAAIGRDEDVFREALRPVSSLLAAA